jgi:hypothetical protein
MRPCIGAVVCVFALACGDDSGGTTDAASGLPIDAAADPIDAQALDASGEARFSATWTLLGGCLDGDEVELTISSTFDGRVTTNRFPCAAGSGVSDHVGAGSFDIRLQVIDTDLEMLPDAGVPLDDAGPVDPTPGALVAESDLQTGIPSVLGADTPITFSFPTNTATVASSWAFSDGTNAQSCAEAGAVTVDLEYERVGVGVERTISLDCTDLADASGDLPTGLYLVRATALDGVGAEVRPGLEQQQVLFVGNRAQTASFSFLPAI